MPSGYLSLVGPYDFSVRSRFMRPSRRPQMLTFMSRRVGDANISIYQVDMVSGSSEIQKYVVHLPYSVCEIAMLHSFPDIYLKWAKDDLLSKWDVDIAGDIDLSGMERMSLEGDFDRYFTTYTKKDKNSDVLLFLTPDTMEGLIAQAAGCDIEIAKDKIFIYDLGGKVFETNFAKLDSLAQFIIKSCSKK